MLLLSCLLSSRERTCVIDSLRRDDLSCARDRLRQQVRASLHSDGLRSASGCELLQNAQQKPQREDCGHLYRRRRRAVLRASRRRASLRLMASFVRSLSPISQPLSSAQLSSQTTQATTTSGSRATRNNSNNILIPCDNPTTTSKRLNWTQSANNENNRRRTARGGDGSRRSGHLFADDEIFPLRPMAQRRQRYRWQRRRRNKCSPALAYKQRAIF